MLTNKYMYTYILSLPIGECKEPLQIASARYRYLPDRTAFAASVSTSG
jgi:hypothetical protein